MSRLRIVLADDHVVVREGLKFLVNSQPDMEVVGEAGNGQEACQQAMQLQPDLVVMDISMPECNGVQATERLKKTCPAVNVLALTLHEEEGYLRRLLQAGASGYLLKRVASEELTRAIRTVAEGGVYLDPTMAGKVVGRYASRPSQENEQGAGELSERETEVLCLIAWGYSNKEIAAKLRISVKTVETYKARLMEKLGLQSRVDLVRYALRQGWLQET